MLDFDRFDRMLAENRIIRNAWVGTDAQGRETACALAALVPACGAAQTASACPAEALPGWMAELIPALDDATSLDGWRDRVVRLGGALRLTVGWSPQQWRRCEARVHIAILTEARSHVAADYDHALAAIDGVTALWRRVAAGDSPSDHGWAVAKAKAEAAEAEADAAEATVAGAAAAAAGWAAAARAEAARARAGAAAAAAAAAEAASSWAARAEVAAWDRICDGVIAALEVR